MSMIGEKLSQRYRLESKLGSGGMSTVYLATDETLDRRVAIKVLHREISDQEDQLERFRREARAVASLSHPNLVAVIDAGEDQGHPYIVFEYVPGETLKKRIDEKGRLGLDESAAYAIEIGRGLQAAHAQKLVHRDVKPQNVLIDSDGRAKITDFGIARSLEAHGLTATGRVLGTTDYVSPEQAMGKDVDPRTDIYSLGVLLFEMLTGDVPFHAETQVGVAMKHVNEQIPNVQRKRAETSAALAATLERATAKEPEDRYPDMGHFLADLESALEVEVVRAGHSTGEATTVLDALPGQRRKLMTKRSVSWAGVFLLVAAAAAAIAFAATSGDDGPERVEPEVPQVEEEPVRFDSASDFDPQGGDGEHPDEVGAAIDTNPRNTAWTTETYDTALYAGIKEGVGLILDAGEAVDARELLINTPADGWSAEIYATDSGPPATLEEWGSPIQDAIPIAGKETSIALNANQPNRYFLIWITELAPEADGGPQFRVEISDARFRPAG